MCIASKYYTGSPARPRPSELLDNEVGKAASFRYWFILKYRLLAVSRFARPGSKSR